MDFSLYLERLCGTENVLWLRSRVRAHTHRLFFDSDIRFLRFGWFCWYVGAVCRRISDLAGGLVAVGGPVNMAVGGGNAHARTREENLRTKQFFSHPAGDFLPTYPSSSRSTILPSAPMHQTLSAHTLLAYISICASHPPTTPRSHTHAPIAYQFL